MDTSTSQSTLERRLLSACLISRENYEQVSPSLGGSGLSAIAEVVAKLLEEYYSCDPDARDCPKEVLLGRAEQAFGNPKHVETAKDFISSLDERVSVPNLLLDVRNLKRGRVGDKLAGLLANRQGGPDVDKLIEEYQELGQDVSETDESVQDVYTGVPVIELLNKHFDRNSISFGIPRLDRACDGGARPGHHILVFARPEVGKTLFTLDLVSRFTQQALRVLYVGNEDPMSDIVLRLACRLSRRSRDQVRANPEEANSLAFSRGYENFTGISAAPGTFREIEREVGRCDPDVVVLDQLRNLDVGDDNRVTALEKAAIQARNLAKRAGVVVLSVTQAGESAEGKSHLELSDIDFSKTGIPGAIDLAIGIGATEEDKRYGVRCINLPKNKLGGQHVSFNCKFDTSIGLVEEI